MAATKKMYECIAGRCTSVYTTERRLTVHIEAHHKGLGVSKGKIRCSVTPCNVGFSTSKAMERHVKKQHYKVRSFFKMDYKCTRCGVGKIGKLERYADTDDGKYKHQCDIALVPDVIITSPGLYLVPVYHCVCCRYETESHKEMTVHVNIHLQTFELAVKRPAGAVFQCDQCKYSSNRRANLDRHVSLRKEDLCKDIASKASASTWPCHRCKNYYKTRATFAKHKCVGEYELTGNVKGQKLSQIMRKKTMSDMSKSRAVEN